MRESDASAAASTLISQRSEKWLTLGFQLFSLSNDASTADSSAWLLVSFPAPAQEELSFFTELGNILASRLAMGLGATPVELSPPTELRPERWRQILASSKKVVQQLYAYAHESPTGEPSRTPIQLTLLTQFREGREANA